MAFEYQLERELIQLRRQLLEGSYQPGPYRTFTIHDPKVRLISAAPYRDRVVHHALCNIIEPLCERRFIPQNYANRKGRGLHKALAAGRGIVNGSPWLLKADIRKNFPSIDHAILKQRIRRTIKCRRTLWLIDRIIDNSNQQEPVYQLFPGDDLFTPLERRHGLPIGNLTSQLFANIYLSGLDRYIVDELRIKNYARYVDDFLLGAGDKNTLHAARRDIEAFLDTLRLRLHDKKTVVFPATRGLTFLGFRLYPGRVLAGKRCGRRLTARLAMLQRQYAAGDIDLKAVKQVIASYNGHLQHGGTWGLRYKIFMNHPFTRTRDSSWQE